MEKMNRREVFEKVKTHLLTQNAKSVDEGEDTCLYRGENGLKCGIGALILDEYYHESLENNCANTPVVISALEFSLNCKIDSEDRGFINRLQWIHDDYGPEDWAWKFDEFEKENFAE